MDTNALRSRKRQRKAQRRRRAGRPARLCNAAIGVFGSNPKGTGVLGRHSVLPSSPRPLVLASSCALIGAPGHPFAYAPIAFTGPGSALLIVLGSVRRTEVGEGEGGEESACLVLHALLHVHEQLGTLLQIVAEHALHGGGLHLQELLPQFG